MNTEFESDNAKMLLGMSRAISYFHNYILAKHFHEKAFSFSFTS